MMFNNRIGFLINLSDQIGEFSLVLDRLPTFFFLLLSLFLYIHKAISSWQRLVVGLAVFDDLGLPDSLRALLCTLAFFLLPVFGAILLVLVE
mmetsp:Transcript_5970/g.5382  ORF Transcript_5970/g.5382 Transcript_5970/m.5382 type:complete len:92 (+) Transcript_5970:88-363(+)